MRILIVEDDEFTAKALSRAFDQHYVVEVARDGQAGWELVEACTYDLILLDVMLPKLDGISLCQRLRSQGYQMPLLLLTGRDSNHDRAIGLDAGADDYVIKPFEPEEVVARVRALLRQGSSTSLPTVPKTGEEIRQQTRSALAGVWHRFRTRVSEQVAVLEQTAALLNQAAGREWQLAEQEAHTLAGSLGTFGLTEGSRLARKIEYMLQDAGKSWGQNEAMYLQELVVALRQEIEQTPEGLVAPATNQDERPLLLVVDSDHKLAQMLALEATRWGIRAEIATKPSQAREMIASVHPQVVLLDLSFADTTEDGLTLLAELSNQRPPVPVLVFTAQNGLTARIEVARLGGRTFLQKPVPPNQVMEAVNRVLQQVDIAAAKVMVVDDDPQILAILRTLLEPWGLKVTTLDEPLRFWETLAATSPDLLILDIMMPHLSGIELCQIVRNDSRCGGLPILFLTAHTDAAMVNQVFAVGADDYVSKPIVGPELVTRIINRLERIKLLRNLAETDPLTRVSNRHKSTQDLEQFLSLAKQYNQPLNLAIL